MHHIPRIFLLPALLLSAIATGCGESPNSTVTASSAAASAALSLSLDRVDGIYPSQVKQAAQHVPNGLPVDRSGVLRLHGIAAGFNPDRACEPFAVIINDGEQVLPEMVLHYAVVNPATGDRKKPDAGILIRPMAPGFAKMLHLPGVDAGCAATQFVVERLRCRDEEVAPTACPFSTIAFAVHGLDPDSSSVTTPATP